MGEPPLKAGHQRPRCPRSGPARAEPPPGAAGPNPRHNIRLYAAACAGVSLARGWDIQLPGASLHARVLSVPALFLVAGCAHSHVRQEAAAAADLIVEFPAVVVSPVRTPESLEIAPALLAHLDTLIAARLRAGGLRVVPGETYLAEWDSALQRHGGLVLAESGAFPADRYERARRRFVSKLRRTYGDPVMLYPELEVVDAPFEGHTATWDGTSQRIPGTGNWLSDFGGAVVAGAVASLTGVETETEVAQGVISALSLAVYLETLDGDPVYQRRVGIEVLVEAKGGEYVFLEQILGDREQRREAVDDALGPVTDATRERMPVALSQHP